MPRSVEVMVTALVYSGDYKTPAEAEEEIAVVCAEAGLDDIDVTILDTEAWGGPDADK